MLPIAALIVADTTGRSFAGVDLNERAALVASEAGIRHCYFLGPRLPDLSAMRRLRERGAFTMGLLGWPRVFAGIPNAETIVLLDARTVLDGPVLRSVLDDARAHQGRASLLVDLGPRRKDSLIQVENGRVTSVMGDGNGTNCGVLVMPQSLVARVRTVQSLRDAVHRLAKADLLAAVATGDRFCRVLNQTGAVDAIEREYTHSLRMRPWRTMTARVTTWFDAAIPARRQLAAGL